MKGLIWADNDNIKIEPPYFNKQGNRIPKHKVDFP